MSTRGAITRLSRVTPPSFRGVYHHWDSYPAGLGQALWSLFHGHFKQDLPLMLTTLIDRHPAGWSSVLHADFTQEPGFCDPLTCDCQNDENDPPSPSCYCHGDRKEEAWEVTEENASGAGCEWVYAFTADHRMLVLSSYTQSGQKMIGMFGCGDADAVWRITAVINLFGDEPDWERVGKGTPPPASPAPSQTRVKVQLAENGSSNGHRRNGHAKRGLSAVVQRDPKQRSTYRVRLPKEDVHYVTRSIAYRGTSSDGAAETYCCTGQADERDKTGSATPDCLHVQAVETLLDQKRKKARERAKRGLSYHGSRVRLYHQGATPSTDDAHVTPATQPLILVQEEGASHPLDPRPSQLLRNHSPDGFEWGYAGSGPAQLALAILLDYGGDEELALAHYQAFKATHLAPLPRDAAWTIYAAQVETFLSARQVEKEPFSQPLSPVS